MGLIVRIAAAVVFALLLFKIFSLISKGRLMLKYSLLWIFLDCLVLLAVLFPDVVYAVSDCIGFVTPSNFVFVFAIVLLILICLSLSVAISRLVLATKNLTQRVAILEKEIELNSQR